MVRSLGLCSRNSPVINQYNCVLHCLVQNYKADQRAQTDQRCRKQALRVHGQPHLDDTPRFLKFLAASIPCLGGHFIVIIHTRLQNHCLHQYNRWCSRQHFNVWLDHIKHVQQRQPIAEESGRRDADEKRVPRTRLSVQERRQS